MSADIQQKKEEIVACVQRLFDRTQSPGDDTNLERLRELSVELVQLEDVLLLGRTRGGIIGPRLETPQQLIRELLREGADRCCVCEGPATRYGTLALILSDTTFFCDKHSFVDVPRYESAKATYTDAASSSLIRRALKWLDENKVEEKT